MRNRTCTANGSAAREVERMMRDGEITDAQSIAAFALLLLSER